MRRRLKQKPNAEIYALKRDYLSELEEKSEAGQLDLLYGDASHISLVPCVPYAWQFKDEQVAMPSERGGVWNCFSFLSRRNSCQSFMTEDTITSAWISEKLDTLSLSVKRLTVVVLDNARVHTKAVKERYKVWEERGLFVFFLPTYSPHLNIVETLWRKLKYEWLRPEDYTDKDTLHYAVWQALSAVGKSLCIQFSPFRKSNAFL